MSHPLPQEPPCGQSEPAAATPPDVRRRRDGRLRWALAAFVLLSACAATGTVGQSVALIGAESLRATATTAAAAGGPDVTGTSMAGPDLTAPQPSGASASAASSSPVVPTGPSDRPGPSAQADPASAATEPPAAAGDAPAGATCRVGAARTLGLDAFYAKACVVAGLPVVAAAGVDDVALTAAGAIVAGMLAARPDLAASMARRSFRLGIIGVDQRAVDLPEYRDLPTSFPRTDWDAARAYGATPRRPLAAAPEENLVCSDRDTYPGQSVLVHELGHSVLDMAVLPADPTFEARIERAFLEARNLDVYRNTYAMTNTDEYWAEGVQDYFDASRAAYGEGGGGDGYDGPIFSRETLRRHDPTLYGLIATVFTELDWRPACPDR